MSWSVPKIWQGGDVWILGGGSSVTKQFGIPEDVVDEVIKGVKTPEVYSPYMKPIHNKHVVGINVAYLIGNWIDMIFFGDNHYFSVHKERMFEFPGLKISCATVVQKYLWVRYLSRDNRKPFGISDNPAFVCWNRNSGSAAISVAANAGAKRIFLLGFDMKVSENNSQHWHNLYNKNNPLYQKTVPAKILPFSRHLEGFPKIAEDAKRRGVLIYNVCPDSAIEVFPRITLQEALAL